MAKSQASAKRKNTPTEIETNVLTKCQRRCALCYAETFDLKLRKGQIAHINGDRSDAREANLAWLCLEHHSEFDSKTSQTKNWTPSELRRWKARVEELMSLKDQQAEIPATIEVAGDYESQTVESLEALLKPINEMLENGGLRVTGSQSSSIRFYVMVDPSDLSKLIIANDAGELKQFGVQEVLSGHIPPRTALQKLLSIYRLASKTEREKGTYFEELIRTYLRYEPTYADLYSDVWLLSEVPDAYGISKKDTGIDLVAKTRGTDELHAIQCKFYDEGHRISKSDIDSFFTASGQKPFSHRVIVATTNDWSDNAEAALFDQQPPVTRIDLYDLETSQIDWSKYQPDTQPVLVEKYAPREHQETAISRVVSGLKTADRGKLIMACGTGKTFTSLKIAEQVAGKNKRVLFLVPSLALLSQTLTEWTQQSQTPLHCFAVCSDAEVGKRRNATDDVVQTYVHELRYPATTAPDRLAEEMAKRHDAQHMSVVFSTYHFIEVLHKAQDQYDLGEFDLIICDEAHRTTGATFDSESESAFVRVHDDKFIHGSKRLYMTATPRIYADIAKATAIRDNVALCSMDDEDLYGEQLHVITFSEAVELGLLTDYKVLVLTIDEDHVSERLQDLLKDDNNQLKVDDAARSLGVGKHLANKACLRTFAVTLSRCKGPLHSVRLLSPLPERKLTRFRRNKSAKCSRLWSTHIKSALTTRL